MSIVLAFVAGLLVSCSNIFMRKTIDRGGTVKAFLVFQMLAACVVSTFLHPICHHHYQVSWPVIVLGAVAGLILSCMIFFLGKAIESGPSGFTFAILNSAAVIPGMIMAFFLGSAQGYTYQVSHGIGSLIVILGLFWGGATIFGTLSQKKWFFFVTCMFLLHIGLLTLFQWRAFLLNVPNPEEFFSFFTALELKTQWFLPSMFVVTTIGQVWIYWSSKTSALTTKEVYYGLVSGIINCSGTFCLVWSTEVASSFENAVIFPIYSVAIIFLTNLWGEKLYQEKVNWKACYFSAAGLVIGTVDWKALF